MASIIAVFGSAADWVGAAPVISVAVDSPGAFSVKPNSPGAFSVKPESAVSSIVVDSAVIGYSY
jgi:hypothetical protein